MPPKITLPLNTGRNNMLLDVKKNTVLFIWYLLSLVASYEVEIMV
jgi:hypothetical protein